MFPDHELMKYSECSKQCQVRRMAAPVLLVLVFWPKPGSLHDLLDEKSGLRLQAAFFFPHIVDRL